MVVGNQLYLRDTNLGGNSVTIEHGFMSNGNFLSMGFYSRSNHFSSINVESGQYIVSGTGIGTAGNTGYSSGPHVDYNIYYRQNTQNFISNLYGLGYVTSIINTTYWNFYDSYYNPGRLWELYH